MSSRQEEKERRRSEREAREQAEARRTASRRRLQLVGGAVLAVAAVVAVVVAITSGGGGSSKSGASGPSDAAANVTLPAVRIASLDAAAKAAGCIVQTTPSEGREHLPSDTAVWNKYKTNPPTSGPHRPTPADDGIYPQGSPPAKENTLHSLEHGRIDIQYKKGLPTTQEDQLEALFNERLRGVPGYHQLLFENQTNMPYAVAVTAWTHLLGCKTFNPRVFDAIRAFRVKYVDKGPELIP